LLLFLSILLVVVEDFLRSKKMKRRKIGSELVGGEVVKGVIHRLSLFESCHKAVIQYLVSALVAPFFER